LGERKGEEDDQKHKKMRKKRGKKETCAGDHILSVISHLNEVNEAML